MAKDRLSTKALYVERGYGQVEPNHLSAQRTGQVYAQLPAAENIDILENGMFVKYDYPAEVVDFTGDGEWMLVFNEVKVYREGQSDCDFAMIKDNYVARVYSPIDGDPTKMNQMTRPRDYSGVVTPADPYEWDATDDPFAALYDYAGPKLMPTNTKMVPRVFKTNVGDIFTTNTINLAVNSSTGEFTETLSVGDSLYVGDKGILCKTKKTSANDDGAVSGDMVWQVVKLYDLGDRQKAVKIMRIA